MRKLAATSCSVVLALLLLACSSSSVVTPGDASSADPDSGGAQDSTVPDAGQVDAPADASPDAPVDKAARCAQTFGTALTRSFGRLDGTVIAIVQPKDTQCPLPNNDHVIVQVLMGGAVYRMVINIQSDRPDPDVRVRFAEVPLALPGEAWAEGWHPGATLDYVADLKVTMASFQPYALTQLSQRIADAIPLDGKVSVYADSSGGASAHKIHRNNGRTDGAIFVGAASGAPRALLFHFATQSF